jgi:hypothetical protein
VRRDIVAELLGISYRQARSLEDIIELDTAGMRVAQVAVALARASGNSDTRLSSLPAIARAVSSTPPTMPTPFHAIYSAGHAAYVVYRADLADAIGTGAVVAKIDKLYPEGNDDE